MMHWNHVSDGGGAEGPGSAEVCQSVAGTAALPDHAQAGAQRPAVLQGATAQEEDRGAGKEKRWEVTNFFFDNVKVYVPNAKQAGLE